MKQRQLLRIPLAQSVAKAVTAWVSVARSSLQAKSDWGLVVSRQIELEVGTVLQGGLNPDLATVMGD